MINILNIFQIVEGIKVCLELLGTLFKWIQKFMKQRKSKSNKLVQNAVNIASSNKVETQ